MTLSVRDWIITITSRTLKQIRRHRLVFGKGSDKVANSEPMRIIAVTSQPSEAPTFAGR